MTAGQLPVEASLMIEHTGQRFSLGQESTTIGRKAGNTIVLADDAAISRRHAIISWQAGAYRVQDAGSANGTYLNEQRLTEPTPLSDGDILRLGQTRLIVQISQPTHLPPIGGLGGSAGVKSMTEPLIETPSLPPRGGRGGSARTTTEILDISSDSFKPHFDPIFRDTFIIQESREFRNNYNIFEPESGQLLFKCMQVQDLVKSLLKPAGHHFDCWLRTPDDKPILRITKSLAVLTARPILVRDERDQIMGEIKQIGKGQTLHFEILDALQDPLFIIEGLPPNFHFTTGGLECALLRHVPANAFQTIKSSQDLTILEISAAVPTHIFIRQMILAAALAALLVSSSQ